MVTAYTTTLFTLYTLTKPANWNRLRKINYPSFKFGGSNLNT